jgi:hypothetical protein
MKKIFFLGAVFLVGCASNPYSEFYRANENSIQNSIYLGEVKIIQSNDQNLDINNMLKKGYIIIGSSNFSAYQTNKNIDELITQAKKIGAEIVLFSSNFIRTETLNVTSVMPTTNVTYIGNTPITSYNSNIVNIPVNKNRNNYVATFLKKSSSRIGILAQDIPDNERLKRQKNKGSKVMIIVDDSPAFNADILVGDIIEEINGITINNTNTAVEIFKDLDVKQFNLKLERNGMIVNKVITLIE